MNKKTIVNNKGFVLPLILVAVFIVLLLSMQNMFFARHTLLYTVHVSNREIAYQAALGGININCAVIEGFFEEFNRKNIDKSSLRDRYKELFDNLVSSDNLLEIKDVEFPLNSSAMEELKEETGDDLSIDSNIKIMKIDSDDENSPECGFIIKITVKAEYLDSSSVISAMTEGRSVFAHLPCVGKFTLYVNDTGDFKINSIPDSKNFEKIKYIPMIIHNGETLETASLKPDELSEFISRQGFIYLGSTKKMKFGMSTMGEEPEYMDAGLPSKLIEFEMNDSEFGKNAELKYYSTIVSLFKESMTMEEREFMKRSNPGLTCISSCINLYGTIASPSPTLVIGEINRNFLLEQGIKNDSSGTYASLPYLANASDFDSGYWPGKNHKKVVEAIHDRIFEDDYERYSKRMSKPVEENYNRGILEFIDLKKSSLEDKEKILFPEIDLPQIKNIRINNIITIPDRMIKTGRITLNSDDDKNIFSGNLSDFNFEEYLKRRICYIHEDEKSFFKLRTRNNKFKIKGIEEIKGDLSINSALRLAGENGGILVVTQDIKINSGIFTGGIPLYIISLNGDIKINTSQKIEAYLAAPDGKIILPESFNIHGGLMMNKMDKKFFKKGKRKKILKWNSAYDITSSDVISSGYRFIFRDEWDYCVR